MKERRTLSMVESVPDTGVSRRAALQTLAAGIGASIAVPGAAIAHDHPVHPHVAHVAEQTRTARTATAAAAYVPVALDPHQFATIVVLAELIVPGAKASGTPEFLDKLLAVELPETRRRLSTALGAIEGAAVRKGRAAFKDLPSAQQVELLTEAANGQPSRPVVSWKKGDPIPLPEPPASPATLRDHFDHIKGWVAGIYFASEPGLKELGYTGNAFHASYTGCTTG